MKILYQIPHLSSVYAARTIYNGYLHAFEDLGHKFLPLTAAKNQGELLAKFRPDILITSLGRYHLKYLDIGLIRDHKKPGLKVFVWMPFWKSPISRTRVNEAVGLENNHKFRTVIESGFGDVFFNQCERGDPRMEGFEEATGYKHYTIPLAADKTMHFPEYSERFRAEISYIGTYLPEKRGFIKGQVLPLKQKYDLRLYGQDWTLKDRLAGGGQKIGQYFNIPMLESLQKPKLRLEDERKIYTSSLVSINVHEDYQRKFGGDCNERAFKIPACGGFEITDDVACISKYFKEGEEIIIAKDKNDWFDKIDFYIRNPDKRLRIIRAGRKRVLRDHTYHNRVKKLLEIYRGL